MFYRRYTMTIYTILFIVEAILVLIGFLVGLKRGMAKALVRLVELIIVAIASLFISKAVMGTLSATVAEILHTNLEEPLKSILLSSPDAEALMLGLAGALIIPIIFLVVFAILKLFSLIGLSALTKLFTKKKDAKKRRLLGGLVGAVTGILVASVFLCPFYTGAKILTGIPFDKVLEMSSLADVPEAEMAMEYFPKADMTPPVSAIFVNAATTFEADGKKYNATDEAPKLVALLLDVASSYQESEEKGEDELLGVAAAISATVKHLEDSEYIATLTTSLLNSIGESIKNGNDVFGIAEGMQGPAADVILKSLGNILTGVTPENIAANIAALAGDGEKEGVLTVITEITSAEDITEVLNDKEKVDKLADSLITIAENPDLSSTMDALTEMGTGMLNEVLPETDTEEREEYMGTLSDSVNELLTATKATQGDFAASVDTATSIIMEKISETETEITEGEAKLIAICALHNFGTAENYANAENAPISIEDIENFFKLNK
jgi:hypothetical protein